MFLFLYFASLIQIYYVLSHHNAGKLLNIYKGFNGGGGAPKLVRAFCFVLRVSWKFLHHIVDLKLHKEFIVWATMKYRFRNSCFYAYNLYNLSKATGIGRTRLRKHVKLFLALGWCRVHSGNLIFESARTLHLNEFESEPERFIKFKISIDNLYFTLLANKVRQKQWVKQKHADLRNPANLKVHKSAVKFFQGEKHEPFDSVGLSLNVISHQFNTAKSTACKILKRLKELKWISVERRREVLGLYSPHRLALVQERNKGWFKSGKYIKRNLPSLIEIKNKAG